MSLLPSTSDAIAWAPLLGQLLFSTPFFVVCGIGIALAIVRWRQHPRVSLFVVLACSIDIVLGLVGAAMAVLPIWYLGRGGTNVELGMVMATANLVMGIVRVIAFGLLLAAVFSGRQASAANAPSAPAPTF
jgi:hypothetical protein